jgi:hypothetical protein
MKEEKCVNENRRRAKKLPPEEKRCRARTRDGEQCRAAVEAGSDNCFFHSQARQAHRKAVERVREVLKQEGGMGELLAEAIVEVTEGKMSPQQAHALAALLRMAREEA